MGPVVLTTGFWNFRGLGAPIRMICTYADVEWEDIKYDVRKKAKGGWVASDWAVDDKPDLQQRNPLIQLPYVINHKTGEIVSQSVTVCLYLGRVFGLNGTTLSVKVANEQVLLYVHIIWKEVFDLVYPSKQNIDEQSFKESLNIHLGSVMPAHYSKLEGWLVQRSTGFFAGWSPCTADFHVWEVLDQHEAMASAHGACSPLADFKWLCAFYSHFRTIPRLQKYFDSENARLPINNKMAFFK